MWSIIKVKILQGMADILYRFRLQDRQININAGIKILYFPFIPIPEGSKEFEEANKISKIQKALKTYKSSQDYI